MKLPILKRIKFWPLAIVVTFFAVFLMVGILSFRDYGTYLDEADQIQIGLRSYRFIKYGDASQLVFRDWDHGAIFEVFTAASQTFFRKDYTGLDVYYMRHLEVYLFFWASAVVFFMLNWHLFKNWKIGLVGGAFLFLSPIIFGNAFYNSKDIPFLSATILVLFSQILFLESPNLPRAGFHALACALAINIRVPGVIFPVITLGMFVLQGLAANRHELLPHPKQAIRALLVFIVLLIGFIVLFFPAIWPDPLGLFIKAYLLLSHRGWVCCNLFFGQSLTAEMTPWYYIPGWIGISTPLYYVILFLFGVGLLLSRFFSKPYLNLTPEKRSSLIFLGSFFLSIAAVVIGGSVVYNSWRHLFFVYAPFLIIAMEGFVVAIRILHRYLNPRLAVGVIALVTLVSFGATSVTMIRNHPYEFIYFNSLVGTDMQSIKQQFDLDYWGLSYVQGLRYVAATDSRPNIRIAVNAYRLNLFKDMLPKSDNDRLDLTAAPENADYFITNYANHPQNYEYTNEVYSVRVGNAAILSVFKLR
jgi:hypothetical protein